MEILINYLKKPFIKRLLVLIVIGIGLYLIKGQITLFLLTFILIYLINSTQKLISKHISRFVKINSKIIIVLIYLLITGLLILLIYNFVPDIIRQIREIVISVTRYLMTYDFTTKTNNVFVDYIYSYFKQIDLQKYIASSGTVLLKVAGSVGSISINILMAIILSLFFSLEKDRIVSFYEGFKDSKVGWLYTELNYFGEKFSNSFGKVIQTQILISFINSILSLIMLTILGFPNTIGLFIMIFILGLVPVVGVFVSIVPLSIIAYTIGGFTYIIYVLIMILILHSLEAYVLNPKLMSQKTKLPVFITFIVLIMSEHIFGTWGLIVGIPVTIFLLDVLEVKTDK
jgi:predicted PurR-regulated permease PerM